MDFFSHKKYLVILFILVTGACSQEKPVSGIYSPRPPSGRPVTEPPFKVQIIDANVNAKLKRVHLPIISMSDWTEGVMILDTAVQLIQKDGASRCEFIDPLVSDESTEIFPFQSFWTVFDAGNFPGGVDHLSSFQGTFFPEDLISPSMFLRKGGIASVEFRYASSVEHSFVKIFDVKVAEDRASVSARFSDPIAAQAIVRVTAGPETCNVKTYFCRDQDRCDNENKFRELSFIHVIQGFLGVPEDVVLGEVK